MEIAYRDMLENLAPSIKEIIDTLNSMSSPTPEAVANILQKDRPKDATNTITDAAKFLYDHLMSIKDIDTSWSVPVLSNWFASQWKNDRIQELIDKREHLDGITLGFSLASLTELAAKSVSLSIGASTINYHTPLFEDDPLSEVTQQLKLSAGFGAIDTGEQINEKYVDFMNNELEKAGYKGAKMAIKDGKLILPIKLMQFQNLSVTMSEEFF